MQAKQTLWLMAASLILLAAAAAIPAQAESTLVFKVDAMDGTRVPAGRIYCGPDAVMTIGGRGWQSIADAEEVARRLNALAEAGVRAEDIRFQRQRKSYLITAADQRIVEIHARMAKFHDSTPDRLARAWADNLRAQFAKPYISVSPILVPVGENRAAPVRGNIIGELSVRADSPVVSASYDPTAGAVLVFGLETGRTDLLVTDGSSVLRVPVRSAKYAARIVQSLTGGVTGSPASPALIARAAAAAVGAGLNVEPGAWASVRPSAGPTAPLAPGRSVSVPIRVSAAGADYLTYHAQPVVAVRNEAPPQSSVDLLMVSNSPERLLAHGLWFEGTLEDYQSARLLFHHVNGSGLAGELVVEIWNLGDQMARVHVIEGLGGPTHDESWAGHKAAAEFLRNRAGSFGWVLPIAPRTAAPVLSRHIATGATTSGLVELRALAPADLRVRLYLAPLRPDRPPRPIDTYSPSPFLGRWQYPDPTRELQARYVVGREWAFITIGDEPAAGLIEGDHLRGSYGVVHNIVLELSNPTAEEVPVIVLLEPGGGPARGFLLIDGAPVEVAVLARDSEARLARYVLAPGERRQVRIQTLPESGSHYPVRLVARPI